MSNRPANFFTELAGVPVHYDRFPEPEFSYGTRGKPMRFHCTPAFQQKLEVCFQELWQVCPLGPAEVITSAGTFVDKPGHHGRGSAFDLDGIFWANKTFITLHYPMDRPVYLAVDALLRKHFGTVLNYHLALGGRTYRFDDASRWLTDAGFAPPRRINLRSTPGTSLAVATRR
jgi:hypothetical protein